MFQAVTSWGIYEINGIHEINGIYEINGKPRQKTQKKLMHFVNQ